ncbi:MAG: 16S rRNA (cytosine(1402)-N(4))-methyltransferase RsmH [Ignavibacteriales bacterium]|nr:MAG: 16S rRNA (cytosine(1402)-N(4))-methyltransferase RsmH [Ignavibacteriales bacterium]
MSDHHTPVLLDESITHLITRSDGFYFDGTVGFGSHTEGILKHLSTNGVLIATDVDTDAFNFSYNKFKDDKRVKLYNYNFSEIDTISKIESIDKFDGIFADLGVSSFQLDNASSGFTYRSSAQLDLRMDKTKKLNASDIVNTFSEESISKILFEFGEEKKSRQIAKKICEARAEKKIETTIELSSIIEKLTPPNYLSKTLSRVFQALRIYVNDELGKLKSFLDKSITLLRSGGRIAILTYHSLEDRIVKEVFKYETLDCICPKEYPICKCEKTPRLKIITRKPITPGISEIQKNRRARSAKLRVAEAV